MGTRRRRVLMLAESAHPRSQSVSWVGWSIYRALSARADVHLVTRGANRQAILDVGLLEGRDFTAISLEKLERPMLKLASRLRGGENKGWTTLMALSLPLYYAFEQEVWRCFAAPVAARAFDVVHRVTPVSPTMPSLMAARCRRAGIPFVVGPLNGGLPWPAEFSDRRRAENEWLSYIRSAYRLVPGYRSTRSAASALLVGSRFTLSEVPSRYRDKCVYLPENGIDPARFPAYDKPQPASPVRGIFVGRLVPYKGCDMVIEAAASAVRAGALTLTIVGDGPERPALEEQARQLGLSDAVRFVGLLPPDQVGACYRDADLLLFPSVREFGGGVVLEAMAMGVVPCVVDYGGPGELVSAESGFRLTLGSRPNVTRALEAVVDRVVKQPSVLIPMREAARDRISRLFTWQRKAEQIDSIYDWVLGARSSKPGFGFVSEPVSQATSP
jgi:glycosyltransferase involved in cell wall biosynthesis